MYMKVIILKITTFFITLGAMLVYNFHKHIKGIKTKRNIKYGAIKHFRKDLNIHYHKNNSENIKRPVIVYFHGGGWTAYSKGIYTTLCKRYASMGYVVFNVNYTLAPKVKMEGVLADCLEAVLFANSNASKFGGDSSQIILAGDSAGAHISSFIANVVNSSSFKTETFDYLKGAKDLNRFKNLCKEAKSVLKDKIKALLLFYGVYDLNTMLASKFPNIRTYVEASLYGKGNDKVENRLFSPVEHIGDKFPPCFIASGEIDKLHESQSFMLKNLLEEKNIKVQNLFFGKEELRAMHAFMIFDGLYTNEKALQSSKEFLEEVLF